jgi:predicted ATP-grasp superfamily ATP-dependent carboligase
VSDRPRVLVTDGEERSALAVCRGLARAGYDVVAVASQKLAVSRWSRSVNGKPIVSDPCHDTTRFVDDIRNLLFQEKFDAIICSTEKSLIPISENRARIESLVPLGLPAHTSVLRALDKVLLQEESLKCGIGPPASFVCDNEAEILEAIDTLSLPVVVKPAQSIQVNGASLHHESARVIRSKNEVRITESLGLPVTVQEFIDKIAVISVAGVFIGHEINGLTVARYGRVFPIKVGSASMAVTIRPPMELIQNVTELLTKVNWEGIFELELLLSRSGEFFTIDLNPRPFGWLSLAIGAGANIPAIWCDHLLGRMSVSAAPAQVGFTYRWEEGEMGNYLRYVIQGEFAKVRSMSRPSKNTILALGSRSDPGPLLAGSISLAKEVIQKRMSKNGTMATNGVK